MSTKIDTNKLGTTLFGKTRRALLALLYSHPDESYYLRQLGRLTDVGMGGLQRELKQLSEGPELLSATRLDDRLFTRPIQIVLYSWS
jgi:hypothetical protein